MKNEDDNEDNAQSCRDCAYFEERRDIDKAVLCGKNQISQVFCPDFEFRHKGLKDNMLYYSFCLECTNFENVVGIIKCVKHHIPGVACKFFTDRFQERNLVKQNKIAENVVLVTPTS